MITPPSPGTVASLLALCASLAFKITGRDSAGNSIGVFYVASTNTQYFMAIVSGSLADGTWSLTSSLPNGCAQWLVRSDAVNILQHGTANADGSVTYSGTTYRLRAFFDGSHNTMEAIAV